MVLEKDFFEIINTRKTIRKYTNEIPSLEAIKKIADAGRLAPCATNTQNWKFIAIFDNNTKERMATAVEKKFAEFQNIVTNETDKNKLNGYKFYSTFFKNAPVVFAIVEKQRLSTILSILERAGMKQNELEKYDYKASLLSMGGAIENMSLCAHALGLGTCWMCAPIIAQDKFGQILNLEQDSKVISLLAVGYPDKNLETPQPPKKTLEEVFETIM